MNDVTLVTKEIYGYKQLIKSSYYIILYYIILYYRQVIVSPPSGICPSFLFEGWYLTRIERGIRKSQKPRREIFGHDVIHDDHHPHKQLLWVIPG